MPPPEKEESLTLEILEAIEADSRISQRGLARELGVALGLANSYLKRCIRKGLVKVQEAPANRYLYYLTPKGFAEKSRLTAEYLSYSFDFYRRAGESLRRVFDGCAANGYRRIVLAGASDLAEIALLRVRDFDLEIVALWDPEADREQFHGLPLVRELSSLPEHDLCVVSALKDPAGLLQHLRDEGYAGAVTAPDILGLRLSPAEKGQ
ncbi:MAG: winged helix-turn-helix transcriptional regulator [Gammaproteobacteria bacterium]|nr:MAG: winged helix-turn-helix transcriptional regulator [Gammaproteobacteria bacterium]